MLTTLSFALEIKFFWKLKVMLGSLLGEIKGFFIIKQIEKLWLLCFCFNFHVSKIWLPAQRACWNNIYKSSEFTFRPAVPSYEALGVEDPNIVPDAQITASSNYLSYYPRKGRLNGDSGWCQQSSKITDNYIQVDMGAGRTVCGVATQGKANGSFLKSYRVSFSTDGTSWTAYKEQNVEKVQHVTVTF